MSPIHNKFEFDDMQIEKETFIGGDAAADCMCPCED